MDFHYPYCSQRHFMPSMNNGSHAVGPRIDTTTSPPIFEHIPNHHPGNGKVRSNSNGYNTWSWIPLSGFASSVADYFKQAWNNISSSGVTWVNPEFAHLSQTGMYYAANYSPGCNHENFQLPDQELWYSADSETSYENMQKNNPHFNYLPQKYSSLKKPLNPEAKEWIPKNYNLHTKDTGEFIDSKENFTKVQQHFEMLDKNFSNSKSSQPHFQSTENTFTQASVRSIEQIQSMTTTTISKSSDQYPISLSYMESSTECKFYNDGIGDSIYFSEEIIYSHSDSKELLGCEDSRIMPVALTEKINFKSDKDNHENNFTVSDYDTAVSLSLDPSFHQSGEKKIEKTLDSSFDSQNLKNTVLNVESIIDFHDSSQSSNHVVGQDNSDTETADNDDDYDYDDDDSIIEFLGSEESDGELENVIRHDTVIELSKLHKDSTSSSDTSGLADSFNVGSNDSNCSIVFGNSECESSDSDVTFSSQTKKGKNKLFFPKCKPQTRSLFAESDTDSDDEEEDDDSESGFCCDIEVDDSWDLLGGLIASSLLSSGLHCDVVDHVAVVDLEIVSDEVKSANEKWNSISTECENKSECKVKFNEEPKVYFLPEDHKDTTKSEWEMHARDRLRFQNRITSLEPILSEVFHVDHRNKIYKKLYEER